MRSSPSETIVAEVLAWSATALETPHPVFGGPPVCPFARAAPLKQAIRFEDRPRRARA